MLDRPRPNKGPKQKLFRPLRTLTYPTNSSLASVLDQVTPIDNDPSDPSALRATTHNAIKMDDPVAQFMTITGQNDTVAAGCLQMTEGDMMAAVNMFFENPDIANNFNQPNAAAAAASSAASASAAPARAQGSSRNVGREDPSGVIHIDSDDDDDGVGDDDDFDIPDDEDNTNQRIAQEDEDAAMARRMQEEMYGEGPATGDGVRAPIGRTTETLVAPSGYGAGIGAGIDEFQDFHQMRDQMRRRAARPASESYYVTLHATL